MKHVFCALALLAGMAIAFGQANAATRIGLSASYDAELLNALEAGLAISDVVYCPKKCTDRADCAAMCLDLGCDVVYARDGTTCSCERILSGGPCPEGKLPRAISNGDVSAH